MFFFWKNEKTYFWPQPEIVILHDGIFDGTKSSLHSCLLLWGRMVFVSILSFEKNQVQIGLKLENIQFFHPVFVAQKNQSEKISTSVLA